MRCHFGKAAPPSSPCHLRYRTHHNTLAINIGEHPYISVCPGLQEQTTETITDLYEMMMRDLNSVQGLAKTHFDDHTIV